MMDSNSNIPAPPPGPEGKVLLLDQPEIGRLLTAERLRIFSAPGAKEKKRYTVGEQNYLSAVMVITAINMAEKIVTHFDRLQQRIADLERQVQALVDNQTAR